MVSSKICGCRSLAWPRCHWCGPDQARSRRQVRTSQANHSHTCYASSRMSLARVAILRVLPTKGQECVVPAKTERRRRPATFDQSRISMSKSDAWNLTVYEIHKLATIASSRRGVSSWFSRSPIIVVPWSVMEAQNDIMSVQRHPIIALPFGDLTS